MANSEVALSVLRASRRAGTAGTPRRNVKPKTRPPKPRTGHPPRDGGLKCGEKLPCGCDPISKLRNTLLGPPAPALGKLKTSLGLRPVCRRFPRFPTHSVCDGSDREAFPPRRIHEQRNKKASVVAQKIKCSMRYRRAFCQPKKAAQFQERLRRK